MKSSVWLFLVWSVSAVLKSAAKTLIPLRLFVFKNNMGIEKVWVCDDSSRIARCTPLLEQNEFAWGQE